MQLAPGETFTLIEIPVVGDLADEPDESFTVRIGNALGANIVDDEGIVTITNDDVPAGQNGAPSSPGNRLPADGSIGIAPDPVLSWSATDPDSDPLSFDVYFGTSFDPFGQVWTEHCAADAPAPRAGAATAYDERSDRLIVFGGGDASGELAETWVLANATGLGGAPAWTLLLTGPGPDARERAAAAFDPATNRFILHGGCVNDCTTRLPDTWVLTGANGLGGTPAWTQLPNAPIERESAVAGYDAAENRLVVFGGAELNDVWVLKDANGIGSPAWEELSPGGDLPAPRSGSAGAYDATGNRLIVFGGRLADDVVASDVWVLADANGLGSPEWSELSPSGTPPAGRWGHAAIYDEVARRLVVFGGSGSGFDDDANFVANDLWLLTFSDTPEWIALAPENGPPASRLLASSAYSPSRDRMVVALGANNRAPAFYDDLSTLESAIGSLPLVSQDQSGSTFPAATPDVSDTYFWRVVARDDHGAAEGSAVSTFQPNAPPSAVNAGGDQTIALSESASLSGSAVDDGLPSGALTFAWSSISGAGTVTFADDTAASTTATFSAPGDYVLRLTASDGELTTSDDVTITVLPDNLAPLVDAGVDQSITLPTSSTSVTGTVIDDGLPPASTVTVTWSQTSGPGTATFVDANALSTSVSFDLAGVYVLRLSANDSDLTGFDELTVTVIQPNVAPTADAGPDQATSLPGASVTLNGVVTDDGLPAPGVSVSWSVVSGPGAVSFGDASSPVTTADFVTEGAYVLRLSADDSELTASDDVTVLIGSSSAPPDLTVVQVDASAIFVDPQTLEMSGTVAAEIGNPGVGPAAGPFAVTFFEDRNQNMVFDLGVDSLLATQDVVGVDAGASTIVSAELPAGGSLLFRGNLVYAFADSGDVVAESDETNNYGSSAPTCDFTPPPTDWNPTLEWSWTSSSIRPDSLNVTMTPVVIDLNDDDIADVVFVTFAPTDALGRNGVLRALDGRDGTELFSVDDPALELSHVSQLAAGDIDLDGRPDIVGVHESGNHLIAFESDGTPKWPSILSDTLDVIVDFGGPALANLDGAGEPEIIIGRQVFNFDGTLRWSGTGGRASIKGPLSLVANIDLTGNPEVVAGNTVYDFEGNILFQNVTLPDGLNALGNFDTDPEPEIVLIADAKIWLLEHDLTVKWGAINFPELPRTGGYPIVADFDGDGAPEIGVPDRIRYYVFDGDGTLLWQAPIVENSDGNGASAFDFEGDGASELVYADTEKLRIYRGSDGTILFETDVGNVTAYEAAITVDVDSDGNAEVVAVASQGAGGNLCGVFVYGDTRDNWVQARSIWNQNSYHITNVNDDGTIPVIEANSWEAFNNYRENAFINVNGTDTVVGCQFAKPDLTASFLRVDTVAAETRLTARIGNGGATLVGPNVPVSFYDGNPLLGGTKLGTLFTSLYLEPGELEDVELLVPDATTTFFSVWVVADDFGGLLGSVSESREDNNAFDSGQALLGAAGAGEADLVVVDVDTESATLDGQTLALSGSVSATVRNQGGGDVTTSFDVTLFEDLDGNGAFDVTDNLLGTTTLASLVAGASEAVTATVSGTLRFVGSPVHVFVDSGDVVAEANETNNVGRSGAASTITPGAASFTPQVEWTWSSSPVQSGFRNVGITPVVADITADGVPDVLFTTFAGGSTTIAYLRAVDGRTGSEIFTINDDIFDRIRGLVGIAVGDVDGNGFTDIVAMDDSNRNLIRYEYDHVLDEVNKLWTMVENLDPASSGAPLIISDITGDGVADILIGRQTVDASDGSILWTGSSIAKGQSGAPLSVAVDLDLDGDLEFVVGNRAYDHLGNDHWTTSLPDGFVAVGNFDADDFPELVHVESGNVRLLEHTGDVKWGPLPLVGTGFAGPPVVADFDGDGRPEIALARRTELTVVETGGFIRWMVSVDHSTFTRNAGAGVSAFDFDGDGAFEIVYQDEGGLRIYSGDDGAVLAEVLLDNCNVGPSYAVVADVDADGQAEIVAGFNNVCTGSDTEGLRAIGDAGGAFVGARGIWNQHNYRVTNVEDDGSIPASESPSWLANNTFRAQEKEGSVFLAPDLTASFVQRTEDGTDLLYTVRIGNAGAASAPAGIPVSMYNGNPAVGFPFLQTEFTTVALAPGEFEDVEFRIASTTAADSSLYFIADDPGDQSSTIPESDEDNNRYDSGLFLNKAPVSDAGPDQSTALPSESVLLQGSFTDDDLPLPVTITTTWQKITGPAGSDLNPPIFDDVNALVTNVSFIIPGTYTLRLRVDDGVRVGTDDIIIIVDPANVAPSVDAGADATLELPTDTLTLNGVVTDDGIPSSGTLSINWTQVSGPGPVSFVDDTAPSTDATFPKVGDYVLRLNADDGDLSAFDEVSITLNPPNAAPVVNAGADETVFSPATVLNGTATDDGLPPGSMLVTTWSVVSGPGVAIIADPSALMTTVEFGASGAYVLRLTADDGALSSFDEVTVTADVTNVAPVVNAGADQTLVLPTDTTTLSGTITDDGLPLGSTVSVVWNVLSAPGPVTFVDRFSLTTVATFPLAGTYVLSLQASDTDLASTDELTVVVDDGNTAPVVDAGTPQTITLPTSQVTLTGSATDDGLPAASTLTFTWSQVSGPGLVSFADPSAASTTATFEADGVYVLRLSVSDALQFSSADVTITVDAAPAGEIPVVEISSPTERQGITDFTDVIGSVSTADLLSWKLEARQEGTTDFIRIANDTVEKMSEVLGTFDPTLAMNGLYEIRLSATNTAGQTAAISVFVVVKENLKIGHFTLSFVDLEVPVSGLPIRITRTYDSRDKRIGDFGFAWRLGLTSLDVSENGVLGRNWVGQKLLGGLGAFCVTPAKNNVVTVTMPDGEVFEFEPVVSPECQLVPISDVTVSYRALPGTNATLEPSDGNFAFVVGSFPGAVDLFGTDFDLYDPEVYRLTLPDGRAFVIDQQDGLKSITDLNGNQLTVTDSGITHSSGKAVDFQRDSEGRIESIVGPNGNPMFYAYDVNGDLTSYTDLENNETKFTYLAAIPHQLEDIVDPRGITPIRNDYDPATGRLIRHTDAFGNTIEYNHDIGARQEVITDRELNVRVLAYDERGNVIRETDPNGKVILRSFDANNNRTCETEPHNPAQSGVDCESSPNPRLLIYDDKDNLLSQTDAEGNTTSFTYNARDQVETTTDPRNKTTTNVYDANGNPTKTIDAAGTETDFTYDTQGNVKTRTVTVGGVVHTTSFDYDASGNPTKETDAEGNETDFTHDSNGNRLTESRTRTLPDSSVQTLTTTSTYDKLGRLVRTTDPGGTFTRTVYDAIGKQKETFDKLGRKTTFAYDQMGQLETITYPDTTTEAFTYDKEGRRFTSADRAGRTTSFEYDELGRLTRTTFPDTTFTQNVYDDAGRLEQIIDARGKITSFEYDQAGRRTAVADPLLNRREFTYDANGNLKTIQDPKLQTTTFVYDELNRRTKTIFPDTTFTQAAYDELGRRNQNTDQAAVVTGFEYDKLGRLTKVIQDVGGLALESTYAYDEVGNRISQTDANLHATTFEYDELGRETKRTLPDGSFETKQYDAAGNLTTWTKFDGSVITYDYDINNRLILKDFPTGTDVTFTYTATGRKDTVTDARGNTDYDYDIRDRLQTLTYPDGRKLDYGYDANSNRTSLVATIGTTVLTTTYTYDDASRLDVVTDPNLGTHDHDYDPNGNRESLSYPNDTATSYLYDDLNRLTNLTTTGPGGTIQIYDFTLGPTGNREQIDEADGTTRAYDYDNLYRLTLETITDALPSLVYEKSFVYDDVGNRETQTTTGLGAGTITYTYDARDRLLTENGTTYGYDANGNLTSKSGDAAYTLDFEDRLIRIDNTDGTVVDHVYDTDGVRVRTTTTPAGESPSITDFLVDTSGSLTRVVAESDGTGNFQAYYVRGDDLLSVIRATEQRYYHADGLGSIRVLTDESGTVSDGYAYTAFGVEIEHTGSEDAQPYAFAGEPLDQRSGLQYHRARWLDPTVGRFLGLDIEPAAPDQPLTSHRYLYAGDDPVNKTDPSGRFFVAIALGFIGMLNTVASGRTQASIRTAVFATQDTKQKCWKKMEVTSVAGCQAEYVTSVGNVCGTNASTAREKVANLCKKLGEDIKKEGKAKFDRARCPDGQKCRNEENVQTMNVVGETLIARGGRLGFTCTVTLRITGQFQVRGKLGTCCPK